MKKWFQHIIASIEHEEHTNKLPIETIFDGVYMPQHKVLLHFVSLNKAQEVPPTYFAHMNTQAAALNCKCIHIWEDVYARQPKLVIARLLTLIRTRQRIHARTTEVKRMNKEEAEAFLNTHHLQQWVNAYYKFGLYHQNELVAVATFSKARVMLDGVVPYRSYEMIRFASKTGVTVTGGLGKLLNKFIQEKHPAHIMTYTDNDWGLGEGYEKLGFTLVETLAPITFYIDPETNTRVSAKQVTYPPTPNLIKAYNSGSNKLVLDLRNYTS